MNDTSSPGRDSSTGPLPNPPMVDDPSRSMVKEPLTAALARLTRPLMAVPSAFQPGRVMLGTLLVALLMTLGAAWDGLFGSHEEGLPAIVGPIAIRSESEPSGPFAVSALAIGSIVDRALVAVVSAQPRAAVDALGDLVIGLPRLIWQHERGFAIGFGLLALAATALCGCALARMTAIQCSTGTRLPASEAMLFAWRRWPRLMGAALLPVGFVAVIGVFLLIPGLLLRVPLLNVLTAVLQGLWLFLALLAVFALTATVLALPLVPAAVACERDDAIEAVQRCVSYWLVRPLHLLAMAATSLVGIALGYLVVSWLASAGAAFAASTVGAWSPAGRLAMVEPLGPAAWALLSQEALGPDSWNGQESAESAALPTGVLQPASVAILGWWGRVLAMVVAGWVISALMTCLTHVYLAVRESADGQDPEELTE